MNDFLQWLALIYLFILLARHKHEYWSEIGTKGYRKLTSKPVTEDNDGDPTHAH